MSRGSRVSVKSATKADKLYVALSCQKNIAKLTVTQYK